MNNHCPPPESGWTVYGGNHDMQSPFDVAVVMPTIGRHSILEAVISVYAQTNIGRIQLLIGVDAPLGDFTRLHELLDVAPKHVTPCLLYLGYSTSTRHGGVHPARDGGALRTVLSYMANARYIAYLDDDNWWSPDHLACLLQAINGRDWAFTLRWFVHPDSRQPICIDNWESTGPGRGVFVQKFGGWVDPNCLMLDKLACEPALRLWSNPIPGDMTFLLSDRHVYDWLQRKSAPGETGRATTYYVMQAQDGNHPFRVEQMGTHYAAAAKPVRKPAPRLTAIVTCKNRLHHLQQTLPILANQALTDVIVVDYGCPQGTADWVNTHLPQVKVVKVTDDLGFNICRARNIGAQIAVTPWLLFIDADIVVGEGFGYWVENSLIGEAFYITSMFGATDVSGTCFCSRRAYSDISGYDEAFIGWGSEGDDLYLRLARAGKQLKHYPDGMFSAIPHDESERFQFCQDTNRNKQFMINHWYLNMKYDLMAAWGRELSLSERASLRKLASDAQQAVTDGKVSPIEVFFHLGERTEISRSTTWKLERRLVYKLVARHAAPTNQAQ